MNDQTLFNSVARATLSALCAGTLMSALPALARNDQLLQPISDVLRKTRAREIVGDMQLRFGASTAAQADIVARNVVVEGVGSSVSDDPRKRELGRQSDEQVCTRAFEDALAKLVIAAREAGAAAIVGIVSNYKGQVLDDPHNYECHAGSVKSYVTLRAQFSRTIAASRSLPPATGFADIDDAAAVPISDQGKERYRHFLTLPGPRAFVVFEDGGWRFYAKDPEAMTKALDECARVGRRCWLYAADDRVVWSADVTRRIGSSAQLEGGAGAPVAVKDDHQ
jgi:uncharacterized protein YbjQ (UPF0145 family)